MHYMYYIYNVDREIYGERWAAYLILLLYIFYIYIYMYVKMAIAAEHYMVIYINLLPMKKHIKNEYPLVFDQLQYVINY